MLKVKNSGRLELSWIDVKNLLLMIVSFLGGFYFLNVELVNNLIGQYVWPEHLGIMTAFVYYFFKQFISDNSK